MVYPAFLALFEGVGKDSPQVTLGVTRLNVYFREQFLSDRSLHENAKVKQALSTVPLICPPEGLLRQCKPWKTTPIRLPLVHSR